MLFTVRLADGPTKYEGRVEVHYNGTWGIVCGSRWNLNNAQVVCSELGYGRATGALIHRALYRGGSGQIWLDDVNCVGTEQTIGKCSHSGWGKRHYCWHYDYGSVRCSSGEYIISLCKLRRLYKAQNAECRIAE